MSGVSKLWLVAGAGGLKVPAGDEVRLNHDLGTQRHFGTDIGEPYT